MISHIQNYVQLESLCIKVIKTILEGLDWGGDIICEPGVGVWTGKLPDYFRVVVEGDPVLITNASSLEKVSAEIKSSAQDIASYQVKATLLYNRINQISRCGNFIEYCLRLVCVTVPDDDRK